MRVGMISPLVLHSGIQGDSVWGTELCRFTYRQSVSLGHYYSCPRTFLHPGSLNHGLILEKTLACLFGHASMEK